MALCSACNFENTDDSQNCKNCGEPILHYNILCGMPMLGGSSRGQVLNLRYIIDEKLGEDNTGCTYKATDAESNTSVLIRALPLSMPLSSEQIERLKNPSEITKLLPGSDTKGLKAFEVSSGVRYFVYEYSEQWGWQGIDIAEQIKNQADEKIASEVSARAKAEAELEEYKNKLEKLGTEAEQANQKYKESLAWLTSQAEQQRAKYEQLASEIAVETQTRKQAEAKNSAYEKQLKELSEKSAIQADKFSEKLQEVEQKLEEYANAGKQFADKQAAYEDFIKRLEEKTSKQQEEFDNALRQAELKFKLLIEREQKALQQGEEAEKVLEQAQWKIGALSAEIEKLSQKSGEKAEVEIKTRPASRFKIAAMVTLVTGLILGAGYLYVNYGTTYKNSFKQWLPVQSASQDDGIEEIINLPDSPAENDVANIAPEYKIHSEGDTAIQELTARVSDSLRVRRPETVLRKESTAENQQQNEQRESEETAAVDMEKQDEPLSAEQLYLEAAQKDDSNAMYMLGSAYLTGFGIEKNIEQAVSWLEKAADANNSDAMLELGLMYYLGQETEKDYDKAFKYFLKSAQAGNNIAMYNVGKMYQQGSGVEENSTNAVEWYEKSAQAGFCKAMNQLAQMYYFGDVVKQDFTKAAEYYEHSAKEGDLKAMYNLAILYQAGVGVERDIQKSMLWLIKAARSGDSDSMYRLGLLFEDGVSIQKDLEKAVYWYQTAAKAGNEAAKQQLAKLGKN